MSRVLDLAAVRGRTDINRTRRLRRTESLRELTREVRLSPEDLIFPVFVRHGLDEKVEIPSMPGVYQWPIDRLVPEAEAAASLGIRALMLFGIPQIKDPVGKCSARQTNRQRRNRNPAAFEYTHRVGETVVQLTAQVLLRKAHIFQ